MDYRKLTEAIESVSKYRRQRKLFEYSPSEKQLEFHKHGASYRQRMLRAGNRVGKSFAGSREMAYHLTGLYPDWWEGRRFDRPIKAWAGGPDEKATREGLQQLLVGDYDADEAFDFKFDEAIPGDLVVDVKKASSGAAGLIDFIQVKHVSGGKSRINIKNYAQGWEKWASAKIDVVWFDEEPTDKAAGGAGMGEKLYEEGRMRTFDTGGISFLTFTPLSGYSDVVARFMDKAPGTVETVMTWFDAPHLKDRAQEEMEQMRRVQPHMVNPRVYGIPSAGKGAVFPIPNEDVVCPRFDIPSHWPCIGGQDYGWDHPSAFVKLAWDRDNDIVYVTNEYKRSQQLPIVHVDAVRHWGGDSNGQWMPWAWGREGLQEEKGSGEAMFKRYREHGLRMLDGHARSDRWGESVEGGIAEIYERMLSGRFKIFETCVGLITEKEMYSRNEEGLLPQGRMKKHDDLFDATRYALAMIKYARRESDSVQRPQAYSPFVVTRRDRARELSHGRMGRVSRCSMRRRK